MIGQPWEAWVDQYGQHMQWQYSEDCDDGYPDPVNYLSWDQVFGYLRQRGIQQPQLVYRASGRVYVSCVFHNEKTPSLLLYPGGYFKCFGCHAEGTIRTFVRMCQERYGWLTGITFDDALLVHQPDIPGQLFLFE